jgi:hypothetical protein
MVHLCAGKFVVFKVDAHNLLGIVNRGSPWLKLNALARELCWFGLEHHITLAVEWAPREENTLVDELSKLLILTTATSAGRGSGEDRIRSILFR